MMLTAAAAAASAAAAGGAPKNCGPPQRGPMMFNGSGATKEVRILPNGFIQTPLAKSCSRVASRGVCLKRPFRNSNRFVVYFLLFCNEDLLRSGVSGLPSRLPHRNINCPCYSLRYFCENLPFCNTACYIVVRIMTRMCPLNGLRCYVLLGQSN